MTTYLKIIILALLCLAAAGCNSEPMKTDAQLGLNAQQARGRRVWEQRCAECHYAYISRSLRAPSMKGLFHTPYMPSGTPANDARVREVILYGRSKMPSFGRTLSSEQVDDLLAYLHTL